MTTVVLRGILLVCLVAAFAPATTSESIEVPHVAVLSVNGAIGPAVTDYLVRTMERAGSLGARLVVIKIDTPGGLDAATRDIIKAILAADIPVVSYVTPAGGRAASAGTYILYASHVAAMSPSTTLGAATPVSIGSPSLPEVDRGDDEEAAEEAPQTAMQRKVVNDAVAYIRGLAARHGRNQEWAEEAVRLAATLTAREALDAGVIDIVAEDMDQLLERISGREVVMESGPAEIIDSGGLEVRAYDPDWRSKLLAIITDPQVAYILLMIGIYGLILEGYNPGALVPGIAGAICLLTAFYALQVLPVNYAGLALIILGALLIVAETLAPSFGVLGIGGIIATTLGSLMLIDSDVPGMEVSLKLIGSIAAASSILVLAVLMVAGRSLRMRRMPAQEAMIGHTGVVDEVTTGRTTVRIDGELWNVTCDVSLRPGQPVRVISQHGLQLQVELLEDNAND